MNSDNTIKERIGGRYARPNFVGDPSVVLKNLERIAEAVGVQDVEFDIDFPYRGESNALHRSLASDMAAVQLLAAGVAGFEKMLVYGVSPHYVQPGQVLDKARPADGYNRYRYNLAAQDEKGPEWLIDAGRVAFRTQYLSNPYGVDSDVSLNTRKFIEIDGHVIAPNHVYNRNRVVVHLSVCDLTLSQHAVDCLAYLLTHPSELRVVRRKTVRVRPGFPWRYSTPSVGAVPNPSVLANWLCDVVKSWLLCDVETYVISHVFGCPTLSSLYRVARRGYLLGRETPGLPAFFSSRMQNYGQLSGWDSVPAPEEAKVLILPTTYLDGDCWRCIEFLAAKKIGHYDRGLLNKCPAVSLCFTEEWRMEMHTNIPVKEGPTLCVVEQYEPGVTTGHVALGLYWSKCDESKIPTNIDMLYNDESYADTVRRIDLYEKYVRREVIPNAVNPMMVIGNGDLMVRSGILEKQEVGSPMCATMRIEAKCVDYWMNHRKLTESAIVNSFASTEEFGMTLEKAQKVCKALQFLFPLRDGVLNSLKGEATRLGKVLLSPMCTILFKINENISRWTRLLACGSTQGQKQEKSLPAEKEKQNENNSTGSGKKDGSVTGAGAKTVSISQCESAQRFVAQAILDDSYAEYLPLRSADGNILENAKRKLVFKEKVVPDWQLSGMSKTEAFFGRVRVEVERKVIVLEWQDLVRNLGLEDNCSLCLFLKAALEYLSEEEKIQPNTSNPQQGIGDEDKNSLKMSDASPNPEDGSTLSSKTSLCPTPRENEEEESSKREQSTPLMEQPITESDGKLEKPKNGCTGEPGVPRDSTEMRSRRCTITFTIRETQSASLTCQHSIEASAGFSDELLSQLCQSASECLSATTCAIAQSHYHPGSMTKKVEYTQEKDAPGFWQSLSSAASRLISGRKDSNSDSSTAGTTMSSSIDEDGCEMKSLEPSDDVDSMLELKEKQKSLIESSSSNRTTSGMQMECHGRSMIQPGASTNCHAPSTTLGQDEDETPTLPSVVRTALHSLGALYSARWRCGSEGLQIPLWLEESWNAVMASGPSVWMLMMHVWGLMKQFAHGSLSYLEFPFMINLFSRGQSGYQLLLNLRSYLGSVLRPAGVVNMTSKKSSNKNRNDFGSSAARAKSVRVAATAYALPAGVLESSKAFFRTMMDPAHMADYDCNGIPDENTRPVLVSKTVSTTMMPLTNWVQFISVNGDKVAPGSMDSFEAQKFYIIQDSNSCIRYHLVAYGTGKWTASSAAKKASGWIYGFDTDTSLIGILSTLGAKSYRVVSKGMTVSQVGEKMYRGGYFTGHKLGTQSSLEPASDKYRQGIYLSELEPHTVVSYGSEPGVYSVLPIDTKASYCTWRKLDTQENVRLVVATNSGSTVTTDVAVNALDAPMDSDALVSHAIGFVPPSPVILGPGLSSITNAGSVHIALRVSTFVCIERVTSEQQGGTNACVCDGMVFDVLAGLNEVNSGFYPANYNDWRQVLQKVKQLYRQNHAIVDTVAGALPYGQTVKSVLDALAGVSSA